MRILLIGPAFDVAGASLNLLRIADMLQAEGHTLAVAAMERTDGSLRQAYLKRGIPVVVDIRMRDFDLAICNTVLTGPYVEQLGARLPVIWWLRECDIGKLLLQQHPSLLRAFPLAARVVMQSQYVRENIYGEALRGVPDERIRIIPQGIPEPESFPRPARGRDKLVVTVGTLTMRKRPRDVFLAVQALQRSNVELVAIGKLQKASPLIFEMAEAEPEAYRIIGELPREACYGWIADADVLAHAASDESQPNVLIEAAFAGTPIAATSLPVLGEFGWVHGENCLLHEVGDVRGLAANIARLLDAPDMAREMAARAQAMARQRFAIAPFRERLLALVDEAVAAAPQGAI